MAQKSATASKRMNAELPMNTSSPVTSALPRSAPARVNAALAIPRGFWFALSLLLGGFAIPLFDVVHFSLQSDFYSYIPLIPFVSLYAVWLRRAAFWIKDETYPRFVALTLLSAGTGLALWHVWDWQLHLDPLSADPLAVSTASFVLLLAGTCFWFFGKAAMHALAFPLLLLVFMIPIPTALIHWIETGMQHGSAAVARELFQVSGMPVFYERLIFQLPSIKLHVAPECSGIRSTMALLIVSVVASCVFLRRPGHRLIVVLVVVPLALLRNGFRIFVIGELCTHYGPQMIDSFIHRRGGPFFFGLSLVPFFLLVVLLQRREQRGAR
jgi:exosortase C (VPDSG-CTERM-specific)